MNQIEDEMDAARSDFEAEMNKPLDHFERVIFFAGFIAGSKNAIGWVKKEVLDVPSD